MKFWQSIAFTETDQIPEICAICEELGFEGVSLSEHLVTPATITSPYPYTPDGKLFWDPENHWFDNMVHAASLGARTTTLKFVNAVVILPLRDPFTFAKSVSSVAYLTANRIVLGVGAGWMKEEFDLTGHDYHTRGRRMDEMIDVMRLLWSGEMVEYHGRFYDFGPVQMAPAPTAKIPIVVGGHSEAAHRRAARNDGFFGSEPYQPDDLIAVVERIQGYRRDYGTHDQPFEILAGLAVPPTVDLLRRLEAHGVTSFVNIPFLYQGVPTSTIGWKRDALTRLAEEVIWPINGG